MTATQPTLFTDRLILRAFTLDDAPAVQRLAGERAIADTTLSIPHPYPDGAAEQWINSHAPLFTTGQLANFAITGRTDPSLLGVVGLNIEPEHARAELGYWIAVPHWGNGYATEAAREVLDFGFRAMHLHRIHARHFTRNPASGRVMQKLGMRLEGVQREAIRKWDALEDLAHYAINQSDWPAPQYYHGTKAALATGDLITPGYTSNFGSGKRAAWVYLAATLDAATWGAELATGDGRGRIYTVEPTGACEDDPNLTNTRFPGNPTKSYRTRHALRVTGEVTEWTGHSAEQIKAMTDHLERLKQQGVEAIEE